MGSAISQTPCQAVTRIALRNPPRPLGEQVCAKGIEQTLGHEQRHACANEGQ